MDLDDFETAVAEDAARDVTGDDKEISLQHAVRAFDETWYSARSRAARWMDLLGDYAGVERFVIDGVCGDHIGCCELRRELGQGTHSCNACSKTHYLAWRKKTVNKLLKRLFRFT